MRNLEDPEFAEVCDLTGRGVVNPGIISYFESKVGRNDDACFYENESFKSGLCAIIVADNKKVDNINHRKLQNLLPNEEKVVICSMDKVKNVDTLTPKLEDVPYTRTGGLKTILAVKVNSPVLVTMNVDKDDFITNGQRGISIYARGWGKHCFQNASQTFVLS